MIIPLGPGSLRDSSSLPEGQSAALFERDAYGPGQPSPPIWPCSTRGFPCPECRHPGGGLLPHLFTLAKCARPMEASPRFCRGPAAGCESHRRYIFCGTFRGRDFAFRLRGTRDATPWRYQARCPFAAGSCEVAAMGVRTFLPLAFSILRRIWPAGDHPTHPPR